MTIFRCVLLSLALISGAVVAKNQNFVGWLIYPTQAGSPSIELPTERGPWRLLRPDGTLLAEMAQPRLKLGYTFNFGECRIGGVIRHDLVAMVRHVNTREWSKEVVTAWIADPKAGRFISLSGRGIECRNEGYGI
ncbi:MAG: hypothetical protein HYX45_01385 [Burkholderiales bacterium]|nr:hypothetical protein [Burkholderiales bacterium]